MVQFKYKNLAEVAEFLEGRAKHMRESLKLYAGKPKSMRAVELRVEASTYENIAAVLRQTELESEKNCAAHQGG